MASGAEGREGRTGGRAGLPPTTTPPLLADVEEGRSSISNLLLWKGRQGRKGPRREKAGKRREKTREKGKSREGKVTEKGRMRRGREGKDNAENEPERLIEGFNVCCLVLRGHVWPCMFLPF